MSVLLKRPSSLANRNFDSRRIFSSVIRTLIALNVVVMVATSVAIPKEQQHKPVDIKLSDEDHFDEDDEHNSDYDHEAFLGKEEAKSFEDLAPEESKARLAIIVDKIDKDSDGAVTEKELKDWIQYTQRRYIYDDVERQWADYALNKGDKLSFDQYYNHTYSFLSENEEPEGEADYKHMIDRDRRRFTAADKDQDGLTQAEFADFLHPEEAEHMKDVVVQETMQDLDKDGDGFVSQAEYLADMYHPDNEAKEAKDAKEPDWVQTEREQFGEFRDKDKDGKLDFEEVKDWIIPQDYDHSEAETKHLISEADADKDGKLTKEEIIEKYDVFVGSQATDFGEALVRHDEF